VWVLAVDKAVGAVGGLAAGEQQRITALAHDRVRAEHRFDLEGAITDRPPSHAHQHSARKQLVVPAAAALVVVDEVEDAMAHEGPVAARDVDAGMLGAVGLPGRPGRFASKRVAPQRTRMMRHARAFGDELMPLDRVLMLGMLCRVLVHLGLIRRHFHAGHVLVLRPSRLWRVLGWRHFHARHVLMLGQCGRSRDGKRERARRRDQVHSH